MPIHEYRCPACGHEFEELVRSAGQKIICPECGATKVDRKLSVIGAVVAGGSDGAACERQDACPAPGSCCSGGACGLQR